MSRPKPRSLADVKHFAKVSRNVVLRGAAPDQCFSSRVFWALILWSWCGPERTEDGAVVQKDANGYILRDKQGEPIPAQQKHILALLGMKNGLKGRMSRTIARFVQRGRVWTDEANMMYVDPEPPAFEDLVSVASTGNWKIADRVVRIEDIPTDPVARTASIRWLEETSTAWKNDLKTLRTGYRKLLVQAVFDGRILIDKKSKRSREDPPSSSALSPLVEAASEQRKKAEEDYVSFKAKYPAHRFDEAKAKPLFRKLKDSDQRFCVKRLQLFLECGRWTSDEGKWVPFASNWLKNAEYMSSPPPALVPTRRKEASTSEWDAEWEASMAKKFGGKNA